MVDRPICVPEVGASSSSRIRFPDRDPEGQRPAKRFRLIGKSSAHKRAHGFPGDLPTPKVDPFRIGATRGQGGCAARPFVLAWGLVEYVCQTPGTCRCTMRRPCFSAPGGTVSSASLIHA